MSMKATWKDRILQWFEDRKTRNYCLAENDTGNETENSEWNREPVKGKFSDYWRAVHYFADGWPVNMWDSGFEHTDEDFEKISADGFNCVVLLIPWREFQPEVNPVVYNQRSLKNLRYLIEKAGKHDLHVLVRLGYFWDYQELRGYEELRCRFDGVLWDETLKNAWFDFASTIYQILAEYPHCDGGFMCWEDFWGVVIQAETLGGSKEDSVRFAARCGYRDYMCKSYAREEIREWFGDEICVPKKTEPLFATFYRFYDEFLTQLLHDTQKVFPGLSMEVRVDDDLIGEGNSLSYYSHKDTYSCEGADYTTIVYGIPMGFPNEGELVSWPEAYQMTRKILGKVNKETEQKKLFVDQLLFYDNTLGFGHNAQMKKEQIGRYLKKCPSFLIRHTAGYGIWTYQNYYMNILANYSFAKGLMFWDVSGDVDIVYQDGNRLCRMGEGARLMQNLSGRINMDLGTKITLQMEVRTEAPTLITAEAGEQKKTLLADCDGIYKMTFDGFSGENICISSDKTVGICKLFLYNFEQEGLLHQADWSEGICMNAVRDMNVSLRERYRRIRYLEPLKNADDWVLLGREDREDNPWESNISVFRRDDRKAAAYMTPGTAMQIRIALDQIPRSLNFKYQLHEDAVSWGISDGANLIATVFDEDARKAKVWKKFRVASDGNTGTAVIDLKRWRGREITVRFLCQEDRWNTQDADWVIVRNMYID